MTVEEGSALPMLEDTRFPAALELVAAHAAGPLGAARVARRSPVTDPMPSVPRSRRWRSSPPSS